MLPKTPETNAAIQTEVIEILALTPPPDRAERLQLGPRMRELQAQLKQKLIQAEPESIDYLVRQGFSFATAEFDRRLDAGKTFPLETLLIRADNLRFSAFHTKSTKTLIERINGGIARCTPQAPLEEIVDIFKRHVGGQLDLNVNFLDVALSHRDDIDQVVSEVLSGDSAKNLPAKNLIADMENRRTRALILKTQRQLKNAN